MKTGKVWLVGAGPGDGGLLTLKGADILAKAEVVVYDSLVGQEVMARIPENARLINVGKRAGNHTMRQEKINEVLLEEAQKGYRVVRLKGGDPFLFGRGGEELELLAANHIPYEVIPGIASPIAVPAYHGIPVTHRDYVSSLHIITGHKREGMEFDIDFEALVRTGGTLVFLMGVSALESIMNGLLKAGIRENMPAAVLMKGTTAAQKKIVATVDTLYREVMNRGVVTPAIIVVGEVCLLAEEFKWYENRPLSGYKVLLTRPAGRASKTAELLREKGAEVLEVPAIRTVPIKDNEKLRKAIAEMDAFHWIVFTSPTGVQIFFDQLKQEKKDLRSLAGVKLAVIGEGSCAKLAEQGLYADLMPEIYDGDSLGKALAEKLQGGERILIPRAEKGNQNLVRFLADAGGIVEDIPIYTTEYTSSEWIDLKDEIEKKSIDCVVFTSSSTVKGFVHCTEGLDYSKVHAACIGEQTRAEADRFGMKTEMAEKATIESLIELVVKMKTK